MASTVAVLYVERDGCYAGEPTQLGFPWDRPWLADVDPWDESRDARRYSGPHPVVAHPPCQLWVNLAFVNFKRYGGAHNTPGNDGGCFAAALASVRQWGGVLEHPAGSHAWDRFDLPRPSTVGWSGGPSEWVCEVWQSAYGHLARKRTWLLFVGAARPFDLNWAREPGTHQVGWFDRNKPTLGKTAALSTPVAFRDALLELARTARPVGEEP